MQSNTDYIPGPSKICRLCKVLEFNDQEYHKLLAETEHIKPVTNGDSYPKRHLEGAEPYKRIDTLPNLPILSGSTSCDFCQLLKGQLQLFWEEWNEERKQSTAKIRTTRFSYYCEDRVKPFTVQPWLSALCIYFTIGSDNGTEHEITFDLHVLPDDPCAKWLRIAGRHYPCDPLSDMGIRRLHEMMQGYQRTPVKVGAPFFPTRLIDVGDAKNHPRLVESANYAPLTSGKVTDNRYVALSYCWGSKKEAERQLKTTKDSLRQNLRSIELGRFSEAKTLRDAVLTCRALGLRYLWIDSLCIIQQDKEDWEKESLKLSQIYKNAFLTICVLRGGSCLTGFLDRRESRPVVNMPFRSVTNPNILGIISLSPPFFSDIESTSECIQESTWNTRGWAFQEALFSPSKLLFGEDMVYYAKLARLESETGVREWQSGWASAVPSEGFDSGGWYNMLLAFTHKDFTYTTDRLPAVSSVAQSYGPAAGKGYLAGLWRSDLEHGLFWQADRGFVDIEDYLDPKKPYVAPSWSWASYPGSVWWAHPMQAGTKYNSHFTLLDANVTVPGLNPFGRPTSGHLKIFGKLHSVRGMKARPEKALLTCVFPWSFHSKGQYVANFKVDWGEAANHDDMPDDQLYDKMSMLLLSSRDLNALEMMTTNQGNPDFARPPETPEIMIGILLLPSDKRSVYTRCGIWFSQRRGIGGRAFWKDITESEVILI